MTEPTTSELSELVQLSLSRATLALLEGDERLAQLALRTDEVFRTDQNEGCRAELKRIGAVIVDLAEIAQKRAPKCAVPDRLQPVIRAMAKEANALVDCAVAGRPVDTSVMHRHVDDLLGRVQRGPSVCSAKSARRAVKLGKSYETIADLTAAMASTTTSERQVA